MIGRSLVQFALSNPEIRLEVWTFFKMGEQNYLNRQYLSHVLRDSVEI